MGLIVMRGCGGLSRVGPWWSGLPGGAGELSRGRGERGWTSTWWRRRWVGSRRRPRGVAEFRDGAFSVHGSPASRSVSRSGSMGRGDTRTPPPGSLPVSWPGPCGQAVAESVLQDRGCVLLCRIWTVVGVALISVVSGRAAEISVVG